LWKMENSRHKPRVQRRLLFDSPWEGLLAIYCDTRCFMILEFLEECQNQLIKVNKGVEVE